jgi:hypothetical protein
MGRTGSEKDGIEKAARGTTSGGFICVYNRVCARLYLCGILPLPAFNPTAKTEQEEGKAKAKEYSAGDDAEVGHGLVLLVSFRQCALYRTQPFLSKFGYIQDAPCCAF